MIPIKKMAEYKAKYIVETTIVALKEQAHAMESYAHELTGYAERLERSGNVHEAADFTDWALNHLLSVPSNTHNLRNAHRSAVASQADAHLFVDLENEEVELGLDPASQGERAAREESAGE